MYNRSGSFLTSFFNGAIIGTWCGILFGGGFSLGINLKTAEYKEEIKKYKDKIKQLESKN